MPLPEPKPLPPLDDLTLEHLGVVASEIQRNQATKEGVMLFTLCAQSLNLYAQRGQGMCLLLQVFSQLLTLRFFLVDVLVQLVDPLLQIVDFGIERLLFLLKVLLDLEYLDVDHLVLLNLSNQLFLRKGQVFVNFL